MRLLLNDTLKMVTSILNMLKHFKILVIILLLISTNSFAGVKKGKGEVKLSENSLDRFIQYIRGKKQQVPMAFILSSDGNWSTYWYCPMMKDCRAANYMPTIRECERDTGVECALFARKYTILWKNGINPGKGKASTIRKKWSDAEIRAKLTELGFLGGSTSSTSSTSTTTPKITKKKETKKVVKKYEIKGDRSIAVSWDGYSDLIAGTVNFNEADYKGTLSLSLPNNDGTCEGSYSLQQGGKGTWQIACTNDMGAAGTLKWAENGSVTGKGRDHTDKKVKFTVSKKS